HGAGAPRGDHVGRERQARGREDEQRDQRRPAAQAPADRHDEARRRADGRERPDTTGRLAAAAGAIRPDYGLVELRFGIGGVNHSEIWRRSYIAGAILVDTTRVGGLFTAEMALSAFSGPPPTAAAAHGSQAVPEPIYPARL